MATKDTNGLQPDKAPAPDGQVLPPPAAAHIPAPKSAQDSASDVDLRQTLFMLWRRKTMILSMVAAMVMGVWAVLTFVAPRYTAEAQILIESGESSEHKELRELISTIRLDSSAIMNEVEVLSSRSLAREVIQRAGLASDPELNPQNGVVPSPGNTSGQREEGAAAFKTFSLGTARARPVEVTDHEMGMLVNNFLSRVNVRPVIGSYVITVAYSSVDPDKAAQIANEIVDVYLDLRLEKKFDASKKITDWLDQRLATLREQVRRSEAAVEAYRAEKNLAASARADITAQQLSALNAQLAAAQSQRATVQARLEQVKHRIENPADVAALPEVLNSIYIQDLKMKEVALQGKLSDLSARYGAKHPAIINLNNELRDLQDNISAEIEKIAKSIDTELDIATARVKALKDGLDELQGGRAGDHDSLRLRELFREAESDRLIFDTFLETYKRSNRQEELQGPDAQVISYATVPHKPSYPNTPLILSLTAIFALFLGILISLLLEKLDRAFRSATHLEKETGIPCYSMVPLIEGIKAGEIADYILSKPASSLAEAVRTLRTVLKLRSGHDRSKPIVVAMTSSFPGEGKTTLSCWLSRVAAKSGEKVVLIDCDLRRPAVHQMIAGRGDKTIVEYLTGQAKLEEVIHKDTASGLHVIYAKSVPNSALDLIDSAKMKNLVASLRQVYDMVVIDTPACLAVSDARVLALQADQTLYCVQWDRTPREVVKSGIKQFLDMGYTNLAFVLSGVDVERHAQYGYGDTAYYYGRYKEYYKA